MQKAIHIKLCAGVSSYRGTSYTSSTRKEQLGDGFITSWKVGRKVEREKEQEKVIVMRKMQWETREEKWSGFERPL